MPMTLRLTDAETEALRETARREHRSMQEVARTAIDEYVTRRARRRDEHLAAIVHEDAELLRRLGEM
jgi:predicted transcriptional regulator